MAKYTAWATILIGSVDTTKQGEWADPDNPTKAELEAYFEKQQEYLAGSNSGSEEIANAYLEIEPDND